MITAADLFCGGGGTSTGLIQAAKAYGLDVKLTAINHWEVAVSTHTANHPDARHLCASLDSLNPRDLFREDELDLLLASPECTHHSVARGGRPINDQSRATAWCVVRWAEALRPKGIITENVPEFLSWGAIDSKGRPMKSKKGATFIAWVRALESLGYRVEWEILCAADYGDPTSRRRLFIQAFRGNRKIIWPQPSHVDPKEQAGFLSDDRMPWRGAKEIIDWSLPSQSIYARKRPLSSKTMARIMSGLQKYGLKPYVVAWDHQSGKGDWPGDQPLSTVTTKARHGIAEPFLIPYYSRDGAHPVSQPVPTITTENRFGVVEPFLVSYYGNGEALSIADPVDTVTTKDRFGLVQPTVQIDGERYLIDIKFRMLQPHELAAAQGFPADYQFTGGKTDAVKQIGNAVPVGIARALCSTALERIRPLVAAS